MEPIIFVFFEKETFRFPFIRSEIKLIEERFSFRFAAVKDGGLQCPFEGAGKYVIKRFSLFDELFILFYLLQHFPRRRTNVEIPFSLKNVLLIPRRWQMPYNNNLHSLS